MLLVGFTTSLPFASISDWFLAATIPLAVMTVPPVLYYSGVWPSPLAYLIPTTGPLLLFGEAFDQITLAPGRSCTRWRTRCCVSQACGGRPRRCSCATSSHGRGECDGDLRARALVAFGRNDIRGTYRDPLLVMIVVAPVIWTTGVAFLTPLFTEMLARRYDFDLVPYYPLVLTAFLLLTSIIIVGGLGRSLSWTRSTQARWRRCGSPPSRCVISSAIGQPRSSS